MVLMASAPRMFNLPYSMKNIPILGRLRYDKMNKRSEVFQRCRHRDGHMLANFYSRGRRNGNRGGALDGVAEEDSGGGFYVCCT